MRAGARARGWQRRIRAAGRGLGGPQLALLALGASDLAAASAPASTSVSIGVGSEAPASLSARGVGAGGDEVRASRGEDSSQLRHHTAQAAPAPFGVSGDAFFLPPFAFLAGTSATRRRERVSRSGPGPIQWNVCHIVLQCFGLRRAVCDRARGARSILFSPRLHRKRTDSLLLLRLLAVVLVIVRAAALLA